MAPPKLGVGLVLAAGLFLLCATSAHAQQEANTTLYATSLYDAIVRSKLTYLQRAVDAAGLTATLSNTTLEATLMAPSNEAFRALFDDDCELDLPAVVGNAEDDDDNDDFFDDAADDVDDGMMGVDDNDDDNDGIDDDMDDDNTRRRLQDDDGNDDDGNDDDDDDDRPRLTLAARRAAAKRAALRAAAAKRAALRAAAKRAAAKRAAAKRVAARKAAARRAFCRRFPRRCRKGGDDDDDKRRRLLDDNVTANTTTNATATNATTTGDDDDYDRCFAALLTDVAMLSKVLQYHVAAGLLPTSAWPTTGAPMMAPTLLANQTLQLSLDTDDSDDVGAAGILEYDDYEVAGARSSAEIIIGDLQAGAGLVHIIDDVLIPQA